MVLPGAVETARLPKEYQEVVWIQSSGTQYIDTGYTVNAADTLSWEFTALIPTHADAYMGANGYMQFHITSSGVGISTFDASGLNAKKTFRIDFSNSIAKLYIDNVLVETKDWTGSYTGTNVKLGIFRLGTTDNAWHASTGLVSCTLYEYTITVGGEIVSHCVPCYRKADDVVGLYDIVNDTFYTNAGTGTFAKGPNVIYNDYFSYTGNYTDNRVNGIGTVTLNTSGTLTVTGESKTVSAYILGGGGGGARNSQASDWSASGGGGGNQTVTVELAPGTYEIVIGSGGAGVVGQDVTGGTGGNTTAFGYTSTGGTGGTAPRNIPSAGTGGTPNGGDGSTGMTAGGFPNGGSSTSTNWAANSGGDGYVELTFI